MEEKTTTAAAERHEHDCVFCATASLLERCWPETTRHHFRNSRIEFLKALRSLLDERIAHLSRKEQKGTHVAVE